jgi:hypothetical protein
VPLEISCSSRVAADLLVEEANMNRKLLIAAALAAGCAPKPSPQPAGETFTPEQLAQRPVCDLVLCVLAEHQGKCCYQLEHPMWDAFDKRMATLADRANRCAPATLNGYFPVAVTYDASGTVTGVGKPAGFGGTLDAPTLACITALVRGVRLPASPTGATLTYPFELHPVN